MRSALSVLSVGTETLYHFLLELNQEEKENRFPFPGYWKIVEI
jgi:hypothetical protein